MSLTEIDVNDDLLWAAMRLLGTADVSETVNAALRDCVRVYRAEAGE